MIQKRFASSVNKKAAAIIYDVGRDFMKKSKRETRTEKPSHGALAG